jgi:hypothetical protein
MDVQKKVPLFVHIHVIPGTFVGEYLYYYSVLCRMQKLKILVGVLLFYVVRSTLCTV